MGANQIKMENSPRIFQNKCSNFSESFSRWEEANETQANMTKNEIKYAERLVRDADLKLKEMKQQREFFQNKSDQNLEQNLSLINIWTEKILQVIEKCKKIEGKIVVECNQTQSMIIQFDKPLNINMKCKNNRESRLEEDLVHDNVERMLEIEHSVVSNSLKDLKNNLDNLNECLRLTRKFLVKIDKDIKMKKQSANVDKDCVDTLDRHDIMKHIENRDNISAQPFEAYKRDPFRTTEEWESKNKALIENTLTHLDACSDSLNSSRLLRHNCQEKFQNAWRTVNSAFEKRIAQSVCAKHEFEKQLTKTREQIFQVDLKLDEVKQSKLDQAPQKERAKKRVTLRAEMKSKRERCFDAAQSSFIDEIEHLSETNRQIDQVVLDFESKLRDLKANEKSLMRCILVKEKSINIDKTDCLELRKELRIEEF